MRALVANILALLGLSVSPPRQGQNDEANTAALEVFEAISQVTASLQVQMDSMRRRIDALEEQVLP